MIEVLREGLVSMLHTRDGARVAMQCVWHGTTKVRASFDLFVYLTGFGMQGSGIFRLGQYYSKGKLDSGLA